MGGCYGWGDVQEQELIDAVHAAVEAGITLFDTADTYGLGQSEKTLGKALGEHRKDVVIASKFGVRVGNGKTVYDNSPEWIQEALEASLKRLGTRSLSGSLQRRYNSAFCSSREAGRIKKEGKYPLLWFVQYTSGEYGRNQAGYRQICKLSG